MRDDEEAVQHAEGERRHGEEVHSGNSFTMIAHERTPCFAGSGFLGAFLIKRSTVLSEMSKPSI